jgi:hypothetical protein
LVNEGYVLLHAPVYGTLVASGAHLMGISELPVLESVVAASVGAACWAFLGTGVGFLLPDLRRRSVILPGASLAGILVFGGMASVFLSSFATVHVLLATGSISAAAYRALLAVFVLLATVLPTGVTALALRRIRERGL